MGRTIPPRSDRACHQGHRNPAARLPFHPGEERLVPLLGPEANGVERRGGRRQGRGAGRGAWRGRPWLAGCARVRRTGTGASRGRRRGQGRGRGAAAAGIGARDEGNGDPPLSRGVPPHRLAGGGARGAGDAGQDRGAGHGEGDPGHGARDGHRGAETRRAEPPTATQPPAPPQETSPTCRVWRAAVPERRGRLLGPAPTAAAATDEEDPTPTAPTASQPAPAHASFQGKQAVGEQLGGAGRGRR